MESLHCGAPTIASRPPLRRPCLRRQAFQEIGFPVCRPVRRSPLRIRSPPGSLFPGLSRILLKLLLNGNPNGICPHLMFTSRQSLVGGCRLIAGRTGQPSQLALQAAPDPVTTTLQICTRDYARKQCGPERCADGERQPGRYPHQKCRQRIRKRLARRKGPDRGLNAQARTKRWYDSNYLSV